MLYFIKNTSKDNPTYQEIIESPELLSGPDIDSYSIEAGSGFLALPATEQTPPPPVKVRLAARGFLTFLGAPDFHPCIGARSVGPASKLFVALYSDMASVETAIEFIQDFGRYLELSDGQPDDVIKTMAAMFTSQPETQDQFAEAYWRFAQLCHDLDPCDWDPAVSSDPADPRFEFSLCGRAVFTTTLNPANPRIARQFAIPTWVMNQTRQFDALRARPRKGYQSEFDRWQTTIRKKDADIDPSGKPNPVLVNHGQGSAFGQLAGSAPKRAGFTPRRTPAEKLAALEARRDQAELEGTDKSYLEWIDNQIESR